MEGLDADLFTKIANKAFGGDAAKARAGIKKTLEDALNNIDLAGQNTGTYQPAITLDSQEELADLLIQQRKGNTDEDLRLAEGMQPFYDNQVTRRNALMKGGAEAELMLQAPATAARERMYDKTLDLEKSRNTGRMIDRIIRGAALAGAMFN